MNIFNFGKNVIYKQKKCACCHKKLSLRSKWFFVNDNVYCSESEANNKMNEIYKLLEEERMKYN